MSAKTATRETTKKSERRLVMVRLESEAEEIPTTHDIFVEAEEDETTRRQAMVAQLKARVQAGTYLPNVELIAERMLSDVGSVRTLRPLAR